MVGSVTLSDVAREAGVSLATASRAVNGSATRVVTEDLRTRVLAAAARLGYTPDATAQAMARGRTSSVGLVVHDIADPYFAAVAAGVTAAAEERGMLVLLANTQKAPEREVELVELLHRQRAASIILAGARIGDAAQEKALLKALDAYRRSGGGIALMGQPLRNLPTVRVDNRGAAAALADALADLGYRRFAIVAGPATHRTVRERADGFVEALARRGITVPEAQVVTCDLTREGGRQAAASLLEDYDRPELVFAVTDLVAIGVLSGLRRAGVAVPGEVAVAGFGGIDETCDVTPALTTVRLPTVRMGELAAALAIDGVRGGRRTRFEVVQGEVVLRESTPPPRPTASRTRPGKRLP